MPSMSESQGPFADSRGGSQAWKKTGGETPPLSTQVVLPTPKGNSETCLTLIPAEIWLLPLAQAGECKRQGEPCWRVSWMAWDFRHPG